MRFLTSARRALVVALASAAPLAAAYAQEDADSARGPVESVTDAFGYTTPRAAVTASVAVVDSLAGAGARSTLSELLTARAPGVSVLRVSGAAGVGSRVRLRGVESARFVQHPILVVDGLRVSADPASASIGTNTEVPSRLDDFAVEDIERVEVLRGPAAAAMYGMGAAAGVIVVTTKSGSGGPFRWRTFAAGGGAADPKRYAAMFGRGGTDAGGAPVANCTLSDAAGGACTPGALLREPALERDSPIRQGTRMAAGFSGAGGALGVPLRIAGGVDDQASPLLDNDWRRLSLRASAAPRLGDRATLQLSAARVSSDVVLPPSGPYFSSLLRHALVRRPDGSTAVTDVSLDQSRAEALNQRARRTTLGAALTWRPIPWLDARVAAGRDRVTRDEGTTAAFLGGAGGFVRSEGDAKDLLTTLAGSLGVRYDLAALRARTALGAEQRHARQDVEMRSVELDADGTPLPSPGAGSTFRSRERVTSLLAQQHLSWRERVELNVGLRGDATDFAPDGRQWSYSTGLAWLVTPGQPALERIGVGSVRLRAAYGDVVSPFPRDAALIFAPALPGEPPLRPERTAEVEGGIEVASPGARLRAEVTAYRQTTRRMILMVLRSASGGFGEYPANAGELTNEGVEAAVRARLLDGPRVKLEGGLTGAFTRSEISEYGGAPQFVSGFGYSARIQNGYAARSLWARRYEAADADGDGVMEPSEIVFGAEQSHIGPTMPTRELALDLGLSAGPASVGLLLDHRGGHHQVNATALSRCQRLVCREVFDPSTALDEQARIVAAMGTAGNTSHAGYIERADFTRLRELWVTLEAPGRWAQLLRARGARVTFSGRNLALFTDYSGLDPEIGAWEADPLGQQEMYNQPLARTFSLRFDVDW
jgi:TonB-dependent SusC/RagA subfamily outer membrane receptor